MLKCKIFLNPKEIDINRFLEKTKGKFVAMTQSESTTQNNNFDESDPVVITKRHCMITILYEVESTGGMQR